MSHRVPPEDIQYQQQHIDDNRASDLITTFATCTALAYLAVVLRLIARRLNKTTLQADDFWVLIALVSLEPSSDQYPAAAITNCGCPN